MSDPLPVPVAASGASTDAARAQAARGDAPRADTEGADAKLVARAHETRVIIIGGGIAGLVCALECAKVGLQVTLCEASEALGGAIRSAEVAGLTVDVGAESYATRGGHVRALIDELGLGDAVVAPSPGGAWVAGLPGGGAAPLPQGGVLGIPENPFAPDVRRVIGWRGAWRAYFDRIRPVLTIGHEHSLGRLVRSRMGDRVLDRLVAPVVTGVYSARPEDVDVDVAAPGLNSALTRVGSLSGAVAVLRGERTGAPGSAVEGLDGGMSRLVDALEARLLALGADVRVGVAVDAIRLDGAVWIALPVVERDETPPRTDVPARTAGQEVLRADAVIVATGEGAARTLLAPHVAGLDEVSAHEPPRVDVVTLVLDSSALDAHPRGSGVLTVPASHTAKALTHSTAKWEWLATDAAAEAPHRHVVRVSFGAQGEAPATAGLGDDAAAALALAEASALLGVPLESAQLVAYHIERYTQSQPASLIGQADASARARTAVYGVPGLSVVGAWIAGTGLAQVVPDAIDEAERVRQRALWD